MSDGSQQRDPAIAVLELESIAAGIRAGDAMIKASPLGSIYTGTIHPGRYVIVVSGDTASVEVAIDAGTALAGGRLADQVFLPDVHPAVADAIVSDAQLADCEGDALGVVETATIAAVIDAADAGVKAARVSLPAVKLADGLGGKGYVLFSGDVAEVEAAVAAATERATRNGAPPEVVVIPQLHEDIRRNLAAELRLNQRLSRRESER